MDIRKALPATLPADCFTGTARVTAIPGAPGTLTFFHVEFEPGGRTAWHRHPHGQLIYVAEGHGLVQRRGGPLERIEAGDVIWTEPGEWHWHGATPGSAMTHLTMQGTDEDGNAAHWGDQVGADEYPAV